MRIHFLALTFDREPDPAMTKETLSEAYPGSMVQTVKGTSATNGFFLQMIAAQTLRAEASGSLLARKPEIDFILRLAGTSQISEAIPSVGAKKGEPFLAVVASRSPLKTKATVYEGRRLQKGPLSDAELHRIEEAALLGARRA